MSDIELITLAGLLALLAIGIWLMFSPVKQEIKESGLFFEWVEPRVSGQLHSLEISDTSDQSLIVHEEQFASIRTAAPDEREHHQDEEQDTNSRMRAGDATVEAQQSGDEAFYLEATEEVESDRKAPALWAKALALNEGNQDKAKYYYIRLRVEQMERQVPVASSSPVESSGHDVAENATSFGVREGSHIGEISEKNLAGAMLDRGVISGAIARQTALGELVPTATLLSDYFVRDYLAGEEVAGFGPGRISAPSYFDSYIHRYSVQVSDVLENAEPGMAKRYRETTPFRYKYLVDFFNEALVVTLLPDSRRIEFFVISPASDSRENSFESLFVSSRITELFLAAAGENPLVLYQELEDILDSLRAEGRD